jgi:glycosyltransferase involved in cell wall biosynthesis
VNQSILSIAVVLPAKDEELLIAECLASIAVAARGMTTVSIIVAADSCVDNTVTVARAFPNVNVLELSAASVGTARRAGVAFALAQGGFPLERTWIANTDADSTVPANWLEHQLAAAASGSDVLVGTVRPRESDLTPAQYRAWLATHDDGQAIGHVHGANLGIRASAYAAVGGFEPLDEHEDNDLVHRIHSAGFMISASDQSEVVTSGRQMGRTPGGYARYLREGLLATVPPTHLGEEIAQ